MIGWLRWTLLSGAGLFLGMIVAAVLGIIGFGLTFSTTSLDSPADWVIVMAAVLPAGAAGGAIAGTAQWVALRRQFSSINGLRWVFLTAVGGTTALWLAAALIAPIGRATSVDAHAPGLTSVTISSLPGLSLLLTGALGAAIGLLFGLLQWLELRRHVPSSGWIWTSTLAWGFAIVLVLAWVSTARANWIPVAVAGMASSSVLIAGIEGIVLVRRAP